MAQGSGLTDEQVAALVAAHDRLLAEVAVARAAAAEDKALIAHQKLVIAKLQRQMWGQKSERGERLIEQAELAFDDAQATATEDELAAEAAVARTTQVAAFQRRSPRPRLEFPAHLPRERVVVEAPGTCRCCGGDRLRKLGEDVTETLESIPRSWKVIQTVREKFTCRDCEAISQAPAPFHAIPRGWAGASLLALVACEKFGAHQPLNRLCDQFAREAIPIPLSTLADSMGAVCTSLQPLLSRIEAHVFGASRLHGDDTTVPVLAKGKTETGRIWTYVRDDRPFGGPEAPAAMFYYSRDRRAEHPTGHLARYAGLFQADAYTGYQDLYDPGRQPGPLIEAACWAHARRPFFQMADVEAAARRKAHKEAGGVLSPIAIDVVRRMDEIFAIERDLWGMPPDRRLAERQRLVRPLVDELRQAMIPKRATLSPRHDLAKAMTYMLKRWPAFTRFLDDGRACMTNNAAERALRGVALGRKSWLFAGSDRGGQRAAAMLSLIATAKMNDVDPRAWLAEVLARIAGHPAHHLDDLLPWNWKIVSSQPGAKAA
mgnify:CR=1 FL=1